jgi:BlaI family transcriptional regulator, penicillinase repressor
MRGDEEPPALSEAQLEIMNLIWDRGEATVGEVWKALAARRPVARNTVQTLIARLEEKGWLVHREEGAGFAYRAARPRETTLRGMVRRLVDTAFSGSREELVLALVEDESLSETEIERIRAIIDRAERRQT